jgi:L-asparaginase II
MLNSPLFTLKRNSYPEITIHGEILVLQDKKVLLEVGNIKKFPARSLLKPFQFLSANISENKWARDVRYTACLGSVSASADQVETIKQWYSAEELKKRQEKLILPNTYPMDEYLRSHLKHQNLSQEKIYHTCFSKHMGILEGCVENNWELSQYHQLEHPYQKNLLRNLQELLESKREIHWVTDGCLLPSPVLSLEEMATLFQKLSSHPTLKLMAQKMMRDPLWVGGVGRSDTKIMQLNKNQVVAKEGADGLFAMHILDKNISIVVKIGAGFLPHYFLLAIAPVLDRLKIEHASKVLPGHEIEYQYTCDRIMA